MRERGEQMEGARGGKEGRPAIRSAITAGRPSKAITA
jgi:hypothetical protein